MSFRPFLVLIAALATTGCNQAADKDPTQVDSELNPNYRQAQQDLDNKNPQGAVADYETALAANPKLPGAHYELGKIFADPQGLNDPISSIYHFKKFLELSPSTDKKAEVQGLIDKESQAYIASLPNAAPQVTQGDLDTAHAQTAALQKQVNDANATITQLQAKLKHRGIAADVAAPPTAPADPTATTDAPATAPGAQKAIPVDQAAAAQGNADTDAAAQAAGTNTAPGTPAGGRTYTVAKGDSYWKIAKKMYPGDTKNGVQKIQDANKQTIGKPLKIGQVLVIP